MGEKTDRPKEILSLIKRKILKTGSIPSGIVRKAHIGTRVSTGVWLLFPGAKTSKLNTYF